jgi:ribose/xylose/arabinose/galactoside ABC-type transport system permease subunit
LLLDHQLGEGDMADPPLLELQNVKKHFAAIQVLRGVSMTVRAGQVTALVGDNGGILLTRTSFGTYVYAIGGNAEAARRAGIPVNRIRVWVFAIAGFMGGVAGLIYASRLRSVSTNLDGGTLVLYCIAASVIGGTSLSAAAARPSTRSLAV